MERFELFDRRYDFLLVPVGGTVLIGLFYGFMAALIAALLIAMVGLLKPLRRVGLTGTKAVLLGTGAALAFSIFLRSFFLEAYCNTASWAVNAGIYDSFRMQMPCFIRGGYLQYALADSWRSFLRDLFLPLAGLSIAFAALPRGKPKKLGSLALVFLLLAGLWLNSPLLRQSDQHSSGDGHSAALMQSSSSVAVPLEPEMPTGAANEVQDARVEAPSEGEADTLHPPQEDAESSSTPPRELAECLLAGPQGNSDPFTIQSAGEVATVKFAGLPQTDRDEVRSEGWSYAIDSRPHVGPLIGSVSNEDDSTTFAFDVKKQALVENLQVVPEASRISLYRGGELVKTFKLALTADKIQAFASCGQS